MNKNELVSHVAAETSATRATAERMVGAVFSAIGDALRGTSPLPSPDSGRSSSATVPRARVAIRKPGSPSPSRPRRCRRSRRQGPSRRGQRIAWRAKRPGAGRSSRQRSRDRCTPSPCLRDEALGLVAGSFPCACVRPIDEPALHASRGRLTGNASRMRSFGRQSAARPDLLDSDCSFAILEWCRSVVCAPVLGQSTSGVGGTRSVQSRVVNCTESTGHWNL